MERCLLKAFLKENLLSVQIKLKDAFLTFSTNWKQGEYFSKLII